MKKKQLIASLLLGMRITILQLMLATTFTCSLFAKRAGGQTILDKLVTISVENLSINKVLSKVQKQTGVEFIYSPSAIDTYRKISCNVNEKTLGSFIEEYIKPLGIGYRIVKGQILLIPISNNAPKDYEPTPQMNRKDVVVSGKITDVTGMPLAGVSVLEKGTDNGTTTKDDGSFSLSVTNANAVLQISYVGYDAYETKVTTQGAMNIQLQSANMQMGEVVVVGYGTQRKKDITGAVGSVSPERFKDQPVTNVEQALKGQVAGVQVSQSTGSPSGGVSIRIRGTSSITAGNDPLYVIDGFPVSAGSRGQTSIANGNPLNSINPNDIESIDILKDASATAIYGSRGSNGVVIITTKSGRSGKSKITFDAFTGVQSVTKKLDMLNAQEFAEFHIDSRTNGFIQSGGDPSVTPVAQRGRFAYTPFWTDPSQWQPTDWQDVIFKTGTIQNFNLGATGGTEKVRYALSGGYLSNEGTIITSNVKRYSFRSNIDATISDKLKVGIKLNPSYTTNNQIRSDGNFTNEEGGMLNQALVHVPNLGPYNPNGYAGYTSQTALKANLLGTVGNVNNPLSQALEDDYTLDQGRVLGSTFFEWEIIKGLKLRSTLGLDAAFNRTHVFRSSKTAFFAVPPPSVPFGSASSSQELDLLNENLLTYEKSFREKHRITALMGYSSQKNDYRFINTSGTQYPNDDIQYVQAAALIDGGTEQRSQWSLLSYFGRVNYSLSDKYLLTATLRRDGSSRFGSNRKYGNFPSAALAWRVSEENFMKDVAFVNSLKLRASYGISGNNSIGNYTHLATTTNVGYVLGGSQTLVNGFRASGLGNSDLTWETKRSYNLGLDLSVFNNRVDFTAEYYKANTDGLLLNVNIPAVSGFGGRNENIGEVENHGVELSLNTRNLVSAFKWSSNFNISFNKNKVLALGGSAGDFIDGNGTRTVVGQPLSRFYLRVTDGIFNTQAEIDKHVPQDNSPKPGDRRFKDVNSDGKVDNNDRTFVGNPNPDFTFGLTNTFSYKGFDLNVLLNGTYGNEIYYVSLALNNLNGNLNNSGDVRNRWRSPENPGSGNIPKAIFGYSTLADVASDYFIYDGSFLRISNVTLGYNLPANWISKAKISGARLFLSGQNLHTFTTYPGFDPEIATRGGSTSNGSDNGIYPMSRVFSLGCNLTF